jgi:cold shock CspA family protein
MSSTGGGGGGVSSVDRKKGCGWIRPDDGGKEVYFEFATVEGGAIPKVGQRVEFVLARAGQERSAARVYLVDKA